MDRRASTPFARRAVRFMFEPQPKYRKGMKLGVRGRGRSDGSWTEGGSRIW
jgi:hypothetical protein